MPVSDCRNMKIPGWKSRIGFAFVKATDLSKQLGEFLAVNPRLAMTNEKGRPISGVGANILQTLEEEPQLMVHRNRGIVILCNSFDEKIKPGGLKEIIINLTDDNIHGVPDGGHTYTAAMFAVTSAQEELAAAIKAKDAADQIIAAEAKLKSLGEAYVFVTIKENVPDDIVADIAEGLNSSLQVDERSLMNLRGEFSPVIKAIKGDREDISFFQGDEGFMRVENLLSMVQMMNVTRFTEDEHPCNIYRSKARVLKMYREDMTGENKKTFLSIIKMIPDFVKLYAWIIRDTPTYYKGEYAKLNGGRFNHEKPKPLPFLEEETTNHEVPQGWLWPMFAAFRSNIKIQEDGTAAWKIPIQRKYDYAIQRLVNETVGPASKKNPSKTGTDPMLYRMLYREVEIARRPKQKV
jgi:hypothetical protein